ncbi:MULTISPECIES: type VII secretion integral membrane protein EccD [unclassified Microbacterium]|uniref:type VII secretion integral membrane protein EccD n=1 Tax=unclassified Microbacterium TaxID=2609290 RepID=UPI00214B8FBC|nr:MULTISPECIES: type VII secretion integral membrane protein EccD [unclassified Microbacterium]MCR2784673.1 type VII secretion integral membrane protein EccD [Microbacterium sp. zg.B96]MDL5352876.1 type VII secretion integral membrane protein EccD [Microbacterium sp. zg-YB36]WIM16214.1 type VII secretion integral membrane protein EccD [Microbacterium sp. zg-B96]
MSQTASATRALIRLSVQSEGRRLDIGIPAQVPVIEFLPGFARSLGVLDPSMTYAGYALHRADGTVLDAATGVAAQGVEDGEVLTLVRGGLVVQPRVYDDIVEAVIDATAQQNRPWTPRDNARTALTVSLTLLGVCAVLLLAAGPSLGFGGLIAGGGAIVLLAVAAVVARLGQLEAGQGLGVAAAVFAGLAGYLAVPSSFDLWGWPLAAAGAGTFVIAGVALALMPDRAEVQLAPLTAGAALAIIASLAAFFPPAPVYALAVGILGTLSGVLPWLALSSTRVRVISPQSDAEMFADPVPIDADDVARRMAQGRRILIALRLALGLVILAATPLVAAQDAVGAALCALAFAGMMFPSRQTYARSGVLAVMAMGTVGLAVSGLTAALTQPELRVALLVVLTVATVCVVTVTLLAPKTRMRLLRVADTVELLVLASLLPLGVIASGLA